MKYGGKDLINSVLEDFVIEASQQIDNCFSLLKNGEIDTLQSELHTLKGSSGTLGIERLEKKTIDLERKLKRKEATISQKEIIEIRNSFQEFQENYKNILEN